jgi:sulfur carrier protein
VGSIPITRSRNLMSMKHIEVTINGSALDLDRGTTVAQLLAQLDTAGKRVAVERNGEIVPKSLHATTDIADGDRLEIVVAVGGG